MNKHIPSAGDLAPTPAYQWSATLWFRGLFIVAIALGIFFRSGRLGYKIYSHDEALASLRAAGYSGGEAFTGLWDGDDKSVQDIQKFLLPGEDKNISDTFSVTAFYGPHQAPLFYLLEHYWMRLIGYTPAAMRGLAAVFGLFSIPAMFWLGWELFRTRRAALLATALFSLSPFHILYAQDARPYSLWTLATLLSSAAFFRAIRVNDKTTWLIYSLTIILGVYSHQLFILVILAHGFHIIGVYLLSNQKVYGKYLLAGMLAFLAYTPWLFYVANRWTQVTEQMSWVNLQSTWFRYIQRWLLVFSSPLIDLDFKSDTLNLAPYFLRALTLLLVAVALLYLLKHGSAQEKSFIVLIYFVTAGTFIALDLLFGGIRSTTGRYFVPANIATILVVAYFLNAKFDLSGNKTINNWKVLLGLLMLASVFSNLNSLYSDTWWNKELGRVRTEFIQEINNDETLLIVSGNNATNLGDVLLLGFELDQDVHLKLLRNPADIKYSDNYSNIFWLPSSYREMQEISAQQQLHVREVLPGILWQIEETSE